MPGSRIAATAVLALAFLVTTSTESHARVFSARALLSWQDYDAGEQGSSGLRQTYELGLRKALSEPVSVRLWFRADGADNDLELGSDSSQTSFRQLKLGGEVAVNYPKTQLRLSWDEIGTDLGGARSGERDLTRGTALWAWRPDGLPDLTVEAEVRGFTDELRGEERTDRRLQATLSETYGPLFLAGTLRSTELDDARGSRRATDEMQGRLALDLSFLDGRLASSTQLYLLESRIDEQGFGLGAAPVSERLRIAAAATGIDETPEDARDRPLDPTPALIDGLFLPTGIAIGPGGQVFRNVALDFGRFTGVDEVLLYVRDPQGELVPTRGQLIDWRIYVSDNQLDWRRVAVGVRVRFDTARSLFEVAFPRLETRYLKLVSFGLNLVETDLVEVEAIDNRPIGPGERRISDSRLASAESTLTGRPSERLRVSWTTRWNLFTREPRGGEEDRTTDLDHYASLLFQPLSWADVQLRFERRSVDQSRGFRQEFEQWATDLILRPKPGLDLRLEALMGRDDTAGQRIESDGLALKTHASLWRTLDLRLDLGELRYRRVDDRRTERRRYATAWAIAQVTSDLQVTASLTEADTVARGADPDAPRLSPSDERRWSVDGYWRAGPPLGLGARYGRVSGDGFDATLRGLRLEWSPFHGGALRLSTIFDEEADTLSRRTFRRMTVAPSWTINRYTLLSLNYTILDFDGPGALRTESFFANLQVRR